ncbi:MAG: hypothetical protein GC201_16040 [Alphaproteobacteria bacterium]|nr:hypothetical protein [Alphaproteobacteria bacterium]
MRRVWATWFGVCLLAWAGAAAAQGTTHGEATQPDPLKTPLDQFERNPIPERREAPRHMDWGGLKPDRGREETFYFCAPCHSDARIVASRKTRAQWAATIDWMLAAYPEYKRLDPDERNLILDYLARNYGPQSR